MMMISMKPSSMTMTMATIFPLREGIPPADSSLSESFFSLCGFRLVVAAEYPIAKGETDKWFANLKEKKPKAPEFPDTPEEKAAVSKMLKTLKQPPSKLTPDYDRSILKSAQENKRQPKPGDNLTLSSPDPLCFGQLYTGT